MSEIGMRGSSGRLHVAIEHSEQPHLGISIGEVYRVAATMPAAMPTSRLAAVTTKLMHQCISSFRARRWMEFAVTRLCLAKTCCEHRQARRNLLLESQCSLAEAFKFSSRSTVGKPRSPKIFCSAHSHPTNAAVLRMRLHQLCHEPLISAGWPALNALGVQSYLETSLLHMLNCLHMDLVSALTCASLMQLASLPRCTLKVLQSRIVV